MRAAGGRPRGACALTAAPGSLAFSLTRHRRPLRADKKKLEWIFFFLFYKKVRIYVTGKTHSRCVSPRERAPPPPAGPGLAGSVGASGSPTDSHAPRSRLPGGNMKV